MNYYNTLMIPDIIQSGLIMNLDFNNIKSYDGTSIVKNLASSVNNGTLINSPTFTNDAGGGLILNGTNQYINCGNDSSLNISNFTVSVWIKVLAFGLKEIVNKNNNANNSAGSFEFFLSNNGLGTRINGTSSTISILSFFTLNEWTKVTFSYDGSTRKVYKNGSLLSSTAFTTPLTNTSGDLTIGAYGNATYPIKAGFGKSYLYNRALTDAEVLQNYNTTKTRFGL